MDLDPAVPFTIPEGFRSGYAAIIGKPNVGKSTLMNALVGRKLSIVTNKPQTTRNRVVGILTGDDHQVVFLDTPGIIEPRYKLHESMMHDVRESVTDADVVVFMTDAALGRVDELSLASAGKAPAILVINKIDLVRQEDALPLVEAYLKERTFEDVIPVSATKGFNLDALREAILRHMPEGPPFYPPDQISEHPERFFVAEMIREKLFEQLREEVPYSTQVNIVLYEEREAEKDLIDAEIVVERESQKGIVIGKKGEALKRVGTAARKDIEEFTGRPVFLRLFVKVREDWRNRDQHLRSYGYRV